MNGAVAAITGTGLEYLQRIVRGEIPGVPIGATLGFRVAEAENGRVALVGRPAGRRLACSEARLTDAAGKLICHATGSCLVLPRS